MDLLTTKQAGEILNVSASRVRQLCLAELLPYQRVGRDLLLLRRDVEKFAKTMNHKAGRPKKKPEE
jgi:excisionase family DNA binding protein